MVCLGSSLETRYPLFRNLPEGFFKLTYLNRPEIPPFPDDMVFLKGAPDWGLCQLPATIRGVVFLGIPI